MMHDTIFDIHYYRRLYWERTFIQFGLRVHPVGVVLWPMEPLCCEPLPPPTRELVMRTILSLCPTQTAIAHVVAPPIVCQKPSRAPQYT
eukprot:7684584-Pyramimonas_sp.AAC.2